MILCRMQHCPGLPVPVRSQLCRSSASKQARLIGQPRALQQRYCGNARVQDATASRPLVSPRAQVEDQDAMQQLADALEASLDTGRTRPRLQPFIAEVPCAPIFNGWSASFCNVSLEAHPPLGLMQSKERKALLGFKHEVRHQELACTAIFQSERLGSPPISCNASSAASSEPLARASITITINQPTLCS